MKKEVRQGKKFIEEEKKESGVTVSNNSSQVHLENPVAIDAQDLSSVYAKLGMTINLGNYESLRIDAGVSYPCSKEDIKEAYEEAFALASEELFKRIEKVKNSI